MGKPFELTRTFVEAVQERTGSEVLGKMLREEAGRELFEDKDGGV